MSSPASVDRLPLPQVPGPKLAPFTPSGHADIKFIKNLGSSKDKDARVWKVEIDGRAYALKMFEFNHWRYLKRGSAKALNSALTNRQHYIDYFDPFCCECRVYGRLKEERREDLAVRAHGYLLLTPEQEEEVTRLITGIDYYEPGEDEEEAELDGDNLWGRYEQHRGLPVRAIVKDLVVTGGEGEEDEEGCAGPFEVEHIPLMWADLEALHALGILVRDIHLGNYLDGKLVDFGRAWTMYHPCLDMERVDLLWLITLRISDARELEGMIDDYCGYDVEGVPEELHACAAGDNDGGTDPTVYNWRERGGEEAEDHVKGLYTEHGPYSDDDD